MSHQSRTYLLLQPGEELTQGHSVLHLWGEQSACSLRCAAGSLKVLKGWTGSHVSRPHALDLCGVLHRLGETQGSVGEGRPLGLQQQLSAISIQATHSFSLIHPFMHPLIHSFTHSITNLVIHS